MMLVPAQMRMQKKEAKQQPNPEKLLQLMKKQLLNLAACWSLMLWISGVTISSWRWIKRPSQVKNLFKSTVMTSGMTKHVFSLKIIEVTPLYYGYHPNTRLVQFSLIFYAHICRIRIQPSLARTHLKVTQTNLHLVNSFTRMRNFRSSKQGSSFIGYLLPSTHSLPLTTVKRTRLTRLFWVGWIYSIALTNWQVWTTFWTRLWFVVTKFPRITQINNRSK